MKTATLRLLALTLVSIALIGFSGCKGKPTTEETAPEATSSPVTETDMGGSADSDSGKAMGLQTVQFAYDSALLDAGGKKTLKANGNILKDKASLKIQIEGHCDERGGIQYNIALGERRATAVKKFLTDMGVNGSRLEIISYGKEKPVDQGHDEAAWAKNRRANFRITSK